MVKKKYVPQILQNDADHTVVYRIMCDNHELRKQDRSFSSDKRRRKGNFAASLHERRKKRNKMLLHPLLLHVLSCELIILRVFCAKFAEEYERISFP